MCMNTILFTFFIYSLRTFTALFWGVFLFFYRKRSPQNLPLSIIFIIIGILYLRNGFVRLPVMDAVDVYNPLSYIVLIFIAPFTIFYAYYTIGEKHSLKHYISHFIPFVFVLCMLTALKLSGVPHIPFCYSLTELVGYAGQYPLYVVFFMLLMIIFIGQVITYFTMALVRFIRIWKDYRQHKVSVRPLKKLIIMDFLFLIYPLVCIVFMSYNNALHFGLAFNIFVAVVITLLSVLNINLVLPIKTDLSFLDDPEKKLPKVHIYNNEYYGKEKNGQLIKSIEDLFEHKEIYRLPNLRLQDIADKLGTNRSYVSACINSHYGCSFSQLLIEYRVNAAKYLLENTSMSIQEIAEHVGFNTRTSFYRAFKEKVSEDLSPVEWRKYYEKG